MTVRLRDGFQVTLRSPDRDDARAALDFLRALFRESSRFLNHPPAFFDALTEEAEGTFLAAAAALGREAERLIARHQEELDRICQPRP